MNVKALFTMSLLCAIPACSGNSDAIDNTPLEPSRDTRIQSLASTACDRYASCTGYGPGKPYVTETDCKTDFQSKASTLWPDSQCNSGQINNDRFEACVQSAEEVACNGTLVDTVVALADCNASKVCTDPVQ